MAAFLNQGEESFSANGYVNSASGYDYPATSASYALETAAQTAADSLPTPLLDLEDWPNVDLETEDVYAPSPILSPSTFQPAHKDSWNSFDSSFQQAGLGPQPTSLANPAAAAAANWTQRDPQATSVSCTPLSFASDPLASTAQDEDGSGSITDSTFYPDELLSTPPTTEDSPPQSPLKAAWGPSKASRQTRKPGRHSSRIKEQQASHRKSSSSSSSSGSKGHTLRGVRNRSKSDLDPESLLGPRSSHNMVEKQYRNRLNGQFSNLLDVLPLNMLGAEIAVSSDRERKVSKGEVLVHARRYIQKLEQAKRKLEEDKRGYEGVISRLKVEWMRRGGELLP